MIIPVIDDEDVFGHSLELVACCCYVRVDVDRNLFDLGVADGCVLIVSVRGNLIVAENSCGLSSKVRALVPVVG